MKYTLRKMTRQSLLLLLFIVCSVMVLAQEASYKKGVKQGQIKVKFAAEMSSSLGAMDVRSGKELRTGMRAFDAVAKNTSAKNMYRLFPYDAQNETKLRKHGLHLWYVVEIDEKVDPVTAAAQFKQLGEVSVAEVEHEKIIAPYTVQSYTPGIGTYDVLPFNDPYLKDQWHYDNRSQTGFGDADINVFEAWKKNTGSNTIIVSIHDEGVDVNHKDLKANIWINQAELNGVTGVDDDGNGFVDDINGYNFEKNRGAVDPQYHGTHVAGTIAAVNNNGIGVSGIAGGNGSGNGVKVMSLQILGGAPIERSFVYAANNGAVISQNSWGYTSPGYFDQSVLDAIKYFVDEAGNYPGSPMKGGLVIFAAGNSNYDGEWYPGYYDKAMAVASIGPEWKRAYYSNYGAWVELSAPGGDQDYGTKNGVLSTIPKDQYAYLQGTSMACPHVSGIAALALSNRTKQLTNTELWNKLVTGVVNIDEYNPDFIGKMGSGAIDADMAIQNDLGKAPAAITNLAVTGVAQEFATLRWSVPTDEDDGKPLTFSLYVHTQPITTANLNVATKTVIKNTKAAGEVIDFEVEGLLGVTTYYFAITSTDRWGNSSLLSNVATETTNQGPSIAMDENSQEVNLEIDVNNSFTASQDLTILNQASGILRWNHFVRQGSVSLSFNAANLRYPKVTAKPSSTNTKVAMRSAQNEKGKLRSNEPVAMAFTPLEKSYTYWSTNIIGETDLRLTNSAAARFYVTEPDGFNLTQVRMYMKHDPAKGPVIVEIYKGTSLQKNNLLFAQEYTNGGDYEHTAFVNLDEQLFFESGETFWVVFHVPAGNLFPLGIGYEADPEYSKYCFMSFDLGAKWIPLEEAINSKDFAWSVTAASENQTLGNYLVLEPGSGDVSGHDQTTTTLTADAQTLINGNYNARLVITSNDPQNRELRVPVNLSVTGQQPNIKHIDIADFGAVFQGTTKTLDLVLDNQGYGNFNDPQFSISDPQFSIVGYAPWQIKAREEVVVQIKFSPATTGNINGTLEFTNGNQSYQIALFGVGTETSKIALVPEQQTIDNITIGDVVQAQVSVQNTGAFPLKYFIPGFDTKGVSNNWPSDYHTYGYKFRTNYASEVAPLDYAFQDIAASGINITASLKDAFSYVEVEMGFDFPYYGNVMNKIYVAQKGFTVFDNSVNPLNSPSLGNPYNPRGYISPLGGFFDYITSGNIFYQLEADRIIIQYDNVWDGYNPETITAQMVLYANGDIRFFYEDMGFSEYNQQGLTILIEDLDQQDGILVHNYNKPISLYSGLALGFDYPGPNIITNVVNGSGIVMPGSTVNVDLTLSTASLVEGATKRYINFISNDPAQPQKYALIQLEITGGGIPVPVLSTDTLDFGNVFQGAVRSKFFTIKNTGSSNVGITAMNLTNGSFVLTGETATVINPGLYKKYDVKIPTSTLASLEDWLTIHYSDGSQEVIYIVGNVVEAPAIAVDLSTLQETLAFGETSTHPFTIENTGAGILEVVPIGKQWVSFHSTAEPAGQAHAYEMYNDGRFYQWIDIRKSGVHLSMLEDFSDPEDFWRRLELPFPIEFYGKVYTEFKIGYNGLISFAEEPAISFFPDHIPSTTLDGPAIMPYWTFSGFDTMFHDPEDVGIFYQFYDDKFIITWSVFVNNFGGMGDPVSAQIIFYKNGTMKFQYKREEGGVDLTSQATTIGFQESGTSGVSISDYLRIEHGKGLAYIILPAKKYAITPGETLSGAIHIDARNIYGGTYMESLKLQTNVPGSEDLEKPVELTVTGEAVLGAPELIDFGTKMITYQVGSPYVNMIELELTNEGAAALEITWAQMADATQGLNLMMLADGWFGPEWSTIDNIYSPWSWNPPVYTILPGDKLQVRAIFYPEVAGDFNDEIIFTTNIGELRIPMHGIGIEPPTLELDKTPIEVVMNTPTETENRSIAFNNLNGQSELTYEVSIDFGRAITSRTNEAMATSATGSARLISRKADVHGGGIRTSSVYNRILKYTSKEVPDTHVGIGGAGTFVVATKFNAGPQGFNLSHVETWFRSETVSEGFISVEIRAGGGSISNAKKLGEGQLNFTGSGSDNAGSWRAIPLSTAVGIYPNEDFYVIVTYPLGIEYPQGVVNGEPTTPGRYFYFNEGEWFNVQEVSGFTTTGWLMYAAEETEGNTSWLSITSELSGSLAIGEEHTIDLLMEGAYAQRGDQVANIVVKTNDPNNTTATVPVKLRVNEGPQFSGVPEVIMMAEKEVRTLTIGVVDLEGHTFTLQPAAAYAGVSHTLANGILTVVLAPDYGDAGSFVYQFNATDEFNATSELKLHVEIDRTNQAPAFVGVITLEYYTVGNLIAYSLGDFFTDADGDELTYTVTTGASGIIEVFTSTSQFLVKPLVAGETTLQFIVKDSWGAETRKTVNVIVHNVLAVEDDILNGIRIYPNPVKDVAQVELTNEWKGEVTLTIIDALGRSHSTHQVVAGKEEVLPINVAKLTRGIYILRVDSKDKRSAVRLVKE
ncbi:MAG: S8 family serine peptidase [Cyclobacteriaceae bacterium]|nr:S8 family serine peptidase [Cyclobacteriaceae bacterium]